MVGALFILALFAVAAASALVIFNAFRGYQSAVDARAEFNSEKLSEQMAFGQVGFGGGSGGGGSGTTVTITVTNGGPLVLHLVSLWITGPVGPTHYASTLSGSSHFDEWVAIAGSATFTVAFNWTQGTTYVIELVSGRGSMWVTSLQT